MSSKIGDVSKSRELLRSVLNFAVFDEKGGAETKSALVNRFVKQVDSSTLRSLSQLVELASTNRITRVLDRIISESETIRTSSNMKALRQLLDESLQASYPLLIKRDEIIRRLSELLWHSSVDYLFFKTLNPFGGIGVDVDLLIKKEDYFKFVEAMTTNSFIPIDSLGKTYATGFVLKGGKNPIIVDLHTDIAILGVRYLSPGTLFSNKVEIEFQITKETETMRLQSTKMEPEYIKLNVLNDKTSAVVAMAHAVIKEGLIKASDLLEVCQTLHSDINSFVNHIESEHLEVANEVFMSVLNSLLPVGNFISAPMSEKKSRSLASKIAMAFLSKSLGHNLQIPVKIPTQSSMLAFFETVRSKEELGQAIPKAISVFGLGRNPARAGQKLTSFLRK